MDLDQIKTFLEVAKQANFSRAAEKVFRSQPAVSAQIRMLEEEYRQRLFDRSGKSVRLTPAGEIFRQFAEEMLRIHRESLDAVANSTGVVRGVLSIGANEGTFLYVLPEILKRFHKLYPEVRISVYRNFSHKVLEKIEDGSIDLGIVTLPVRNASLKVVSIFRDQLQLLVSARAPVASKKIVTLQEVSTLPLIFPKTGHTRRVMEKCLRPYRANLHISMELSSLVMIKEFVAAEFGASLLSASFARQEVQSGRLKLIPIKDLDVWRELGLVYRKDRTLPRVTQAFLEMARNRMNGNGLIGHA